MTATLLHYPNCSTCRRARKWLTERGIDFELVDLVAEPPDAETLRGLWRDSGLPVKKLFNTSGQSYRQGDWKDRLPELSDDDKLAALAADGKLVKRPILRRGETVLVGFDAETWAEALEAPQG